MKNSILIGLLATTSLLSGMDEKQEEVPLEQQETIQKEETQQAVLPYKSWIEIPTSDRWSYSNLPGQLKSLEEYPPTLELLPITGPITTTLTPEEIERQIDERLKNPDLSPEERKKLLEEKESFKGG